MILILVNLPQRSTYLHFTLKTHKSSTKSLAKRQGAARSPRPSTNRDWAVPVVRRLQRFKFPNILKLFQMTEWSEAPSQLQHPASWQRNLVANIVSFASSTTRTVAGSTRALNRMQTLQSAKQKLWRFEHWHWHCHCSVCRYIYIHNILAGHGRYPITSRPLTGPGLLP